MLYHITDINLYSKGHPLTNELPFLSDENGVESTPIEGHIL